MSVVLYRGANHLLERSFLLEDGATALPASDVASLQVELMQAGAVVETLVRGVDGRLRNSGDGTKALLELTAATTSALEKGPLTLRWSLNLADADFDQDGDLYKAILVETPIVIA